MRTNHLVIAAGVCTALAAATWTLQSPPQIKEVQLSAAVAPADDSHVAVSLEGSEDEGFNANVLDELFQNVDPDTALFARLRQMRGHLDAAEELYAAGEMQHVLEHIRHPVEEVYGLIEEELKKRHTTGFLLELRKLETAFIAKKSVAEIDTTFAEVKAAMSRAESTISAEKRAKPSFILDTIALLLRSAALEYKEAYQHMRITNVVEYHDGRGFVREARAMLTAIAPVLQQRDKRSYDAVLGAFAELETAWPTAMPPERPVRPRTVLHGFVSLVELHANRLR